MSNHARILSTLSDRKAKVDYAKANKLTMEGQFHGGRYHVRIVDAGRDQLDIFNCSPDSYYGIMGSWPPGDTKSVLKQLESRRMKAAFARAKSYSVRYRANGATKRYDIQIADPSGRVVEAFSCSPGNVVEILGSPVSPEHDKILPTDQPNVWKLMREEWSKKP